MSNTSIINVTNINIAVVDAGQTKQHQTTSKYARTTHGNRKRQSTASTHKQQVT